ncbi:MAG: hypothetical protein JOZ32_08420 [Bryobacterales bacterium]|nr:hypothetical protein [Bryobacterales bacterium]
MKPADRAFVEDLEHRSFVYFWEQADRGTGLVLDRARVDGGRAKGPSRDVASTAATGFGLTAICIGAEHGWITKREAADRVRTTLRFFANVAEQEHGWFYHWMDVTSGERKWDSEMSSIDTSFLLGGVLTAAQYFSDDPEIPKLAGEIYNRVDFQWMLNGDSFLLSHGWIRGKGFLKYRWDTYCELSLLYLLAIGSPTHPIPADSWYAWQRPLYRYGDYDFISGGPLFTHQYSHAWIDFRNRRDRGFIDFFRNSVNATRANRQYSLSLDLPSTFGPEIWGITASDGPKGYRIYGEIKAFDPEDGTVAPAAAAGSLMFTPDISIPALKAIRERYADQVFGRYGFVDGYNPTLKWFDTDVLGIDVGITLLSAENLLTGNVWRWFMANEAVPHALDLIGFSEPPGKLTTTEAKPPDSKKPAKKKTRAMKAGLPDSAADRVPF